MTEGRLSNGQGKWKRWNKGMTGEKKNQTGGNINAKTDRKTGERTKEQKDRIRTCRKADILKHNWTGRHTLKRKKDRYSN